MSRLGCPVLCAQYRDQMGWIRVEQGLEARKRSVLKCLDAMSATLSTSGGAIYACCYSRLLSYEWINTSYRRKLVSEKESCLQTLGIGGKLFWPAPPFLAADSP